VVRAVAADKVVRPRLGVGQVWAALHGVSGVDMPSVSAVDKDEKMMRRRDDGW
jgi:hypothetical protein